MRTLYKVTLKSQAKIEVATNSAGNYFLLINGRVVAFALHYDQERINQMIEFVQDTKKEQEEPIINK